MELTDVLKWRRSIRKFKPDSVPDNYIKEVIEAARLAPSGSNLQPSRFIVVKNPDIRKEFADVSLKFVADAPVIIVCCADLNVLKDRPQRMEELINAGAFTGTDMLEVIQAGKYADRAKKIEQEANSYLSLNVAIAIEHMVLRATDLGLSSCWVMMFKQEKVKQILDLEDSLLVVALVPIGFADQAPGSRPRHALEKILLKTI